MLPGLALAAAPALASAAPAVLTPRPNPCEQMREQLRRRESTR
jgi:hypothetical protein